MHSNNDDRRNFSATRRSIVASAAALPALAFAGRSQAQEAKQGTADFLFVQTASGMAFDPSNNRLTLQSVSPVTLFFSDRPERIAGNMKTDAFVPFWSDGTNSFLSDPPNADISVLDNDKLIQTVVVLRDPVLSGDDLHYTVEIIDGDMPDQADNVSVFIDIIGMPLTPLSFAGVRRRAYRRAIWR